VLSVSFQAFTEDVITPCKITRFFRRFGEVVRLWVKDDESVCILEKRSEFSETRLRKPHISQAAVP
jgi:hypothetical protein